MRTTMLLVPATLLLLVLTAGAAVAMQPPGDGAQDRFGCVENEDDPIGGHPGSTGGLDDATFRLMDWRHPQSGDDHPTGDHPTAWNAVANTGGGDGWPIKLGSC